MTRESSHGETGRVSSTLTCRTQSCDGMECPSRYRFGDGGSNPDTHYLQQSNLYFRIRQHLYCGRSLVGTVPNGYRSTSKLEGEVSGVSRPRGTAVAPGRPPAKCMHTPSMTSTYDSTSDTTSLTRTTTPTVSKLPGPSALPTPDRTTRRRIEPETGPSTRRRWIGSRTSEPARDGEHAAGVGVPVDSGATSASDRPNGAPTTRRFAHGPVDPGNRRVFRGRSSLLATPAGCPSLASSRPFDAVATGPSKLQVRG